MSAVHTERTQILMQLDLLSQGGVKLGKVVQRRWQTSQLLLSVTGGSSDISQAQEILANDLNFT